MKKRTIKVAFATSNSSVTHGHDVSVPSSPWDDEGQVDRDKDGRDVTAEMAKIANRKGK